MGFFDFLFGTSNDVTSLELKKEQLQAQVDSMAEEANSRLDDLAENEMNSPAFAAWERNGAIRFGVKGKTYQQVQSEYWRIKNFLDAKTSTVAGAQEVLNNISNIVGISTKMTSNEASNYFKLADRIKEYYQMSGESAKALDYQLIWEQVNIAIENGFARLDQNDYTVNEIHDILEQIDLIDKQIEALSSMNDDIMADKKPKGLLGSIFSAIGGFFKGLFK